MTELSDSAARLIIRDSSLVLRNADQDVAAGPIQVDAAATPHTLDLKVTRGEYKGKQSLAIWEIRGDTLRACWTMFVATRARPTTFATQKGAELLLGEYVRER